MRKGEMENCEKERVERERGPPYHDKILSSSGQ